MRERPGVQAPVTQAPVTQAPGVLAKGLRKRFGEVEALAGLDLEVAAGEVVCLLGANGAGKTTTLLLLLGLLQPSAGSVSLAGVDMTREPLAGRRRALYLPERVALYPRLSGLENLDYLLGLAGEPLGEEQLLEHLAHVGLDAEAARRPTSGYSKGMRQKVALAMARARRAQVLLLDEPLSGLDPASAGAFCETVAELARAGASVLMTTHDLYRARQVSQRIAVMTKGRLVSELRNEGLSLARLEEVYLEAVGAGPEAAAEAAQAPSPEDEVAKPSAESARAGDDASSDSQGAAADSAERADA